MAVLLKRVVLIQALFRGFMIRKRLEEIRSVVQNGTENGEFDDKVGEKDLFQNAKVREVYQNRKKFVIPDLMEPVTGGVVEKGPYKLTSGAIYIGEW
jgi:hypothetical protein